FLHLAVKLGRRCLVKLYLFQSDFANCIQKTERAEPVNLRRVIRNVERHLYVALSGEIIDLIRFYLFQKPIQTAGIDKVTIMQEHPFIKDLRVFIKVVYPARVERAGTAD